MINPIFNHDFEKFVLQNLSPMVMPPIGVPRKLFSIPTAKKTKKDMKKEDSPWVPKQPNSNEDKKS